MKTLIELSGNKVAIVEYCLQSRALSLRGKKGDDLIECGHRIEGIVVVDYKTGERMVVAPSDIISIADEIKALVAQTKMVPLFELV